MILSNSEITSKFIIGLSVYDSIDVRENLINPMVSKFFRARNIEEYNELDFEYAFSDLDFKNKDFDFIYCKLLSDICRKEKAIHIPVKYLVTLDKESCSKRCEKTGLLFDTIDINRFPFFYFIHFDFYEILKFIRSR